MHFFPKRPKRSRGRHRQRRTDIWHRMSEYLWPSIGWIAFLRHSELKLKRTKGSAHLLALGFACGIFSSFTPFVGLHILLTGFLAIITRSSIIAGCIGTLIGNPWTFPFIWLWSLRLGDFILGNDGSKELPNLLELSLSSIWANIGFYWENFLWPMFVGGVPTGLLAALGFYLLLKFNIDKFHAYRRHRIAERRKFWIKVKHVSPKETAKNLKNKFLKKTAEEES